MTPAIGIDLGTAYSCVGVFHDGAIHILSNDCGKRTTPSYVAFTDTERLIGDPAQSQGSCNPGNTVFDAKRLIGRHVDDASLQTDMIHWPFKVRNDNSKHTIQVFPLFRLFYDFWDFSRHTNLLFDHSHV